MSVPSDSAQLSAQAIAKRYGTFTALDDIYLDVHPGEFLTLLGPSGSGKTTLLMILAGFLTPSDGRLLKGGEDISRVPAEQRNFGMVFQGYALFPHLSVAENVAFPLRVRKVREPERSRRVEHVLELVGLAEHGRKKPAQLSGGQQQRVAIARALVFEPEVLLLDEPLSALDKNLREQLQAELKRLHRQVGTTFVFVTHDQNEALALSSRIAVFDHGRLVQIDTPTTLYQQPQSRFVAQFIGQMNFFPLEQPCRDGQTVRGQYAGHTLVASSTRRHGDAALLIAVRPENMTLGPAAEVIPGANSIPVTLAARTYQGAASVLELLTAQGESLQVSVSQQHPLLANTDEYPLQLSWPIEVGIVLQA